MGWKKIIVGSNELHRVAKSYVKVADDISNFFRSTPPTNTINNDTILTQCSIKQGLKVFDKKGKAALRKELQKFHDCRVVKPNKPQDLSYDQRRRSL